MPPWYRYNPGGGYRVLRKPAGIAIHERCCCPTGPCPPIECLGDIWAKVTGDCQGGRCQKMDVVNTTPDFWLWRTIFTMPNTNDQDLWVYFGVCCQPPGGTGCIVRAATNACSPPNDRDGDDPCTSMDPVDDCPVTVATICAATYYGRYEISALASECDPACLETPFQVEFHNADTCGAAAAGSAGAMAAPKPQPAKIDGHCEKCGGETTRESTPKGVVRRCVKCGFELWKTRQSLGTGRR